MAVSTFSLSIGIPNPRSPMLKRFYEQNMLFSALDIPSSKSLIRTSLKADQLVFQVFVPFTQPQLIRVLTFHTIEFYFNYNDAIFGKIKKPGQEGSYLPHSHFIATPLLPCGRVDPPVEKYTGNGTLGQAKDDITKAIHAFVHYSLVISENNLLFCDLQGMS